MLQRIKVILDVAELAKASDARVSRMLDTYMLSDPKVARLYLNGEPPPMPKLPPKIRAKRREVEA